MDYILLPRGIENGSEIIDKFYKQLCLLKMLQGKHELIPPCQFKRFNFNQLGNEEEISFLPLEYTADDLELFSLYEEEELNGQDKKNRKKPMTLPFPCFSVKEDLYRYREIASRLSNSKFWLEQLVRFYDFLSEELIILPKAGLEPADFIYDRDGRIKYFLGFNLLTLKSDRQDLMANNLQSLAYLLYHYYLEDTEKYQARLYKQKWFEKLEGRLIEPLVYGDSSHKLYQNFKEILDELHGKVKYSLREKRIGVFLDTANIMTPLLISGEGMIIDFDSLLAEIYGKIESRKIEKKIAVMFEPAYEESDYLDSLLLFTEEYLHKYGFKVVKVSNKKRKAKTVVNGQEYDVDDIKLQEIIHQSQKELDSILLLTGDRHFYELSRELEEQGMEVRIISVSEDSTYKGFYNNFNHNFLDEYWNCIDYISREDVGNGSF